MESQNSDPASSLRCSFCNKKQDEVQKLIAGPTVYICDECVRICIDILLDDDRAPNPFGHLEDALAAAQSAIAAARALAAQDLLPGALRELRAAVAFVAQTYGGSPNVPHDPIAYTRSLESLLRLSPSTAEILAKTDRSGLLSRIPTLNAPFTPTDLLLAADAAQELFDIARITLSAKRALFAAKHSGA